MKIEKTADGSYTLFVPEMDEHYHSVKGALTESSTPFLRHLRRRKKTEIYSTQQ